MPIEIERNIPLPKNGSDFVRRDADGPHTMPRKWPWTGMRVGDSLTAKNKREARSAHNSFMAHKRTKYSRLSPDSYVIMRKQPDGTYRLWLLDKSSIITD
jgi:hypothetical protein